jgi:hypothetical protein
MMAPGMAPRSRVIARRILLTLVATAVAYGLLSHRSDRPFVFGYSLFYLLVLLLVTASVGFSVVLFRRFRARAWYAIAAIVMLVLAIVVPVEIGAQVYARLNPSYEVLYLQPDRQTGWKGVPNLQFTWAGPHWAAFQFSVPIVFNSAGFRDAERTVQKPPHVSRVALLGDSFVEALQVPFEKTAGQLLERSLNSGDGEASPHHGYEVLNFGVSAHGLGQFLLVWETYARAYQPDYVFAYVAGLHMRRTVSKGGMETQGSHELWTRPTFRLVDNELVLEPAGQFQEFIAAQQRLIRTELGGTRMHKRPMRLFLRIMIDNLNTRLTNLQQRWLSRSRPPGELTKGELAINLRILEELASRVHHAGARLIIVDAVLYHDRKSSDLSATLKDFCSRQGLAYVNVSDGLLAKEDAGISTKRAYDGHFNEVGNEVFAAAMSRWMASSSARR